MSDFQPSRHDWPEHERRAPSALPPISGNPSDPVTKEYLDHALQEWRHASREYFNNHFQRLEAKIDDGFPNNDPRSHREVHEGFIKQAKARRDIWDAVLKQIVTGSVWAGTMAIAAALWIVFKAEVRK